MTSTVVSQAHPSSEFVVSLDFELLWGVRDHADKATYGANILGAREAVPRILELFTRYQINATWATVGFLFCSTREELMEILPPTDFRPRYVKSALSNYRYLDEVGENETVDPYYFGSRLIDLIGQSPGQEIGTHTLSHYYCLEDGQTEAAFEADLTAAIALAARRGIEIRSIVFPRNQYSTAHLSICRRHGITSYRGNPAGWVYEPRSSDRETLLRRAFRLVDAHTGFLGHHAHSIDVSSFRNVPASRFLRPCEGLLRPFHPAHLRIIQAGMTDAARTGSGYHLWWHPHNFGRDTDGNLAGLERILKHFAFLRDHFGMRSRAMASRALSSAS